MSSPYLPKPEFIAHAVGTRQLCAALPPAGPLDSYESNRWEGDTG